MLRYKYNLNWDLQNAKWTLSELKWLNENRIVVFYPNFFRWLWLLFWIMISKKPSIVVTKDITCYWVSSGTWGSYHPDLNAISICPWKVKDSPGGNLESLIIHEIVHLEHPELSNLSFEEREKKIEDYTLACYAKYVS
jgi:hypothetical protein